MGPGGLKHVGVSNVNKGVNMYSTSTLVGLLHKTLLCVCRYCSGAGHVCRAADGCAAGLGQPAFWSRLQSLLPTYSMPQT
jgi:hypothetical protein